MSPEPRPLRILHWYWQTGAGGIDSVVTGLVAAQARDPSLQVRVIAGRTARLPSAKGQVPGVDYLHMRHGFDVVRYGAAARAVAGADLVHMHAYNPVVAAAVARSGKPCLYTDHGTDQYPSVRNRIVSFRLQRGFVRKRAGILTVGSEYRRRAQQTFYGIGEERIRVVPNGVDFALLRAHRDPDRLRTELGIAPGEIVVGTVAVFQMCKRMELLLETYARTRDPATPSRLLIVGDGTSRAQLENRARELGIGGAVIFAGYRQDAIDLLGLMDVFVLPTEGEAFGLAAVEALALARPAVVWRDGGGLTEVVRDGESGYCVSDVAEAVARLRELFADPMLRERLGARGAEDVRTRFSIAAMAGRMRDCYDEVTGRTGQALFSDRTCQRSAP